MRRIYALNHLDIAEIYRLQPKLDFRIIKISQLYKTIDYPKLFVIFAKVYLTYSIFWISRFIGILKKKTALNSHFSPF